MILDQNEMQRLADLAWRDQMDAKVRHENRSFLRTGRMALFVMTACAAVWAFVIYEIVTRTR